MGLLFLVVGIAVEVITYLKANKEFSQICKYVSLASDYKEFSSITAHSTQITQERELTKMKEIGDNLYDAFYGREEAKNLHDAKAVDIQSDYERDLKLLQQEFENAKEQLLRDKDAEIRKIKDAVSKDKEKFYEQKQGLQLSIKTLTGKIKNLEKEVSKLQTQIIENADFINAFETNYKKMLNMMDDSNWVAPMDYTHGKLQNDLYIIPEKKNVDEFGHKQIFRINHNKRALVVTYDISNLVENDGSYVENVGKIINSLLVELMYAVYRMNSRESYDQYIVDEVVCTNAFKSTKYKNTFNICKVVGKIEDIRNELKKFSSQREFLSEKGTQMDDINESKYKSQDRPEVYNLLYIIYKPNERKAKLDDDIRRLIPDCDKYGFMPIFICEKETWNREVQEKESMYKDIKESVNNAIYMYNGVEYMEAN